MDLPLTIYGATFMARPDSGCEDNIVDEHTVAALGLYIDRSASNQKIFRMANGRSARAVGLTSVSCYFPNEPWKELQIQFYVFARLNTPMIIGLSFLDDTQTLVENRHRLQPRTSSCRGPFKVSRLNRPKRWLKCLVDLAPVLANPDTGSDIDLMSLAYVQKRGFEWQPVEPEESTVEFADGSTAQLSGKLVASLAICSDVFSTETMTFYVLENLTCDMLFGEDFLQMKEIFRPHTTALTTHEVDMSISDANTILWQKKAEARLLGFFSDGIGNERSSQRQGKGAILTTNEERLS
ncbi:uncharacterized protein K444DRAFT_2526 [Hyaloscypha bicolor E]|uniref:Uncharacterized protein n=1 Tax=Hyaloscypha bicolor E TaxID=1095630 RepID=A0A2J6TV82_9HELO|nr:uncharacterized protein K444DRAFT_2526 [Hyaloscypha bicolor E]PMD66942.1 hypothetical protein K444DRAFT_2526 [Hyaloscypha bicolor E]